MNDCLKAQWQTATNIIFSLSFYLHYICMYVFESKLSVVIRYGAEENLSQIFFWGGEYCLKVSLIDSIKKVLLKHNEYFILRRCNNYFKNMFDICSSIYRALNQVGININFIPIIVKSNIFSIF